MFAALALFNQLTVPLFIFPITVPIIISAVVSTKRLEEYLNQPEVQKEFEGIRNMARVISRSDASLDVFEIDDNESQLGLNESSSMTPMYSDENGSRPTSVMSSECCSESQSDTNADKIPTQILETRRKSTSIKLKKNSQISSSTILERKRSRQKSASKEIQMEISIDLVASVRKAIFSCNLDSDVVLKIDKLDIPKGISEH